MELQLLLKLTLLSSLLSFASSAFTPNTSYFLDCGSSAAATVAADNPPRTFVPDSSYLTTASGSDSNSLSAPTTSPNLPALYATARVFTAAASYRFKINSPGTHVLRLHFFPFSARSRNLSAARFDVSALDRFLLLANFSIPANTAPPIIKEYLLWVDTDELAVSFTPNTLAFINAIEVFTAPANLVGGAAPRAVDGTQSFGQLARQALETVYRVNVGGPEITPANDTLWRNWAPDDDYFLSAPLAFDNRTSGRITYQTEQGRTPEIAPEIVYSTARTMAVTPVIVAGNPNFNFNLTWSFPVISGFTYFIRMHFCDFISPIATQLYFDVYLGGLLAYQDLHPGDFTDGTLAAAFFVDFAAEPNGSALMNVSVGRSGESSPTTVNAILNGLEIMKINNSLGSLDGGSYNPNSDLNGRSGNGVSAAVLIGSVLGSLILVAVLIAALIFTFRRRRRRRPKTRPSPKPKSSPESWSPYRANSINLSGGLDEGTGSSASPRVNLGLHVSFLEIKSATNDFDDNLVIGAGGFGKVYKGVLRDGTRVAVKRGMPGSKQGYPEFQTEIVVLSRIRHRHLVSLIGYCDEQSEMLLVYEYMEKGPLKNYLYGRPDLPCLPWKRRLEICIAAARGLHYLHTGGLHNIIHRDVKSSNILLGEDYLAKVSDFGLSRLGPGFGETHVSTVVKGSFGYFDPEYFKTQKLTDKSDVYSFGVTLFEVLCARPVIDQSLSREQLSLAEWALHWQRKGALERIVDPRIAGEINPNSLRKFGETAEKCLADYGVDRPAIGDVLWNLEYALQLQETELRREPHEDSGNVETEIQLPAMRPPSSTAAAVDEEEEVSYRPSELSTSDVFSQLVTDEGR